MELIWESSLNLSSQHEGALYILPHKILTAVCGIGTVIPITAAAKSRRCHRCFPAETPEPWKREVNQIA